jgi:hypothetical protein
LSLKDKWTICALMKTCCATSQNTANKQPSDLSGQRNFFSWTWQFFGTFQNILRTKLHFFEK